MSIFQPSVSCVFEFWPQPLFNRLIKFKFFCTKITNVFVNGWIGRSVKGFWLFKHTIKDSIHKNLVGMRGNIMCASQVHRRRFRVWNLEKEYTSRSQINTTGST